MILRRDSKRHSTYGRIPFRATAIFLGIVLLELVLDTSALPVVFDLRPTILISSGVAAALALTLLLFPNSLGFRIFAMVALLVGAGTLMATVYDLRFSYRSQEVSIANGDIMLRGTLYLPRSAGPHPAMILIHGSGPATRLEYGFYARAYARHGVATLAYDKRGSGASQGDIRTATYEQLASDAVSGIQLLRNRSDIDPQRVGIWGLSEGEWVAPLAAIQTDPAFLVLISASAMTPSQQVQYETSANVRKAGFSEEKAQRATELYAKLAAFQRTGAGAEDLNRELQQASREPWFEAARYLERSVPDYSQVQKLVWFPAWRARMDFDALSLLAEIQCPVLAQVGGSDLKNDGSGTLRRLEHALSIGGNTAFTGVLYRKAGHGVIEWRLPWQLPPPWFASGYLKTQLDWVSQHATRQKDEGIRSVN